MYKRQVHRCTPAPYGMLAVPALLPTVCVLQGLKSCLGAQMVSMTHMMASSHCFEMVGVMGGQSNHGGGVGVCPLLPTRAKVC